MNEQHSVGSSKTKLLDQFDNAAAFAQFEDYFVKNYPGPDTIIGNPRWHAPKIWRAALYALGMNEKPAPETLPQASQLLARQLEDALAAKGHTDACICARCERLRAELKASGCAWPETHHVGCNCLANAQNGGEQA